MYTVFQLKKEKNGLLVVTFDLSSNHNHGIPDFATWWVPQQANDFH
jgi:hypothetical protein